MYKRYLDYENDDLENSNKKNYFWIKIFLMVQLLGVLSLLLLLVFAFLDDLLL